MDSELFSVKYPDRHAAALMFRKIKEVGPSIGITACGLDKIKTRSKRSRSQLIIIVAIKKDLAQNLSNHLKIIQNALEEHPLYSYVSFDFCVKPISQTQWSFDSYDDKNYQDIFIRKRS